MVACGCGSKPFFIRGSLYLRLVLLAGTHFSEFSEKFFFLLNYQTKIPNISTNSVILNVGPSKSSKLETAKISPCHLIPAGRRIRSLHTCCMNSYGKYLMNSSRSLFFTGFRDAYRKCV